MILVHGHKCMQTRACRHIQTCVWPCPFPNSSSIVRGSSGVDQLQLRHPFTLPPSLSANPSSCVTAGPCFLPSFLLTQRPGGVTGESGWPDVQQSDAYTHTQTDWQGPDMQTGGCRRYCRLWIQFFLLIRSYKESDIIPVLLGQQEDRGRQRAGCVGERWRSMKETKESMRVVLTEFWQCIWGCMPSRATKNLNALLYLVVARFEA